MFTGRQKELTKMESMYQEASFQFAVIYGRRRVGKTTLIAEFLKDKPSISYIAMEGTMKENLVGLSHAVMQKADTMSYTTILKHCLRILTNCAKRKRSSWPSMSILIWQQLIRLFLLCCKNISILAGKTAGCFLFCADLP